ncbi:MAG: ATP-binding protein [Planctomycetota bacterium]
MNVQVAGEVDRLPGLVDDLHASWSALELPMDLLYAFDLALEEIFVNLATHGRGPRLPLQVGIRLEKRDEGVLLEICDDGEPFDPLAAPPPDLDAPLEERPIGGLGVHLVRAQFPDIDYRRVGGQNVLTLRRPLA